MKRGDPNEDESATDDPIRTLCLPLAADVLTIENSRSSDEMLKALAAYGYSRDLGPGVYDVVSHLGRTDNPYEARARQPGPDRGPRFAEREPVWKPRQMYLSVSLTILCLPSALARDSFGGVHG